MNKPLTKKEKELAIRQLKELKALIRSYYGYGWRGKFAIEMSDPNGNPLRKSNGEPYKEKALLFRLSTATWIKLSKETRDEWVKKIEAKLKEKSKNP